MILCIIISKKYTPKNRKNQFRNFGFSFNIFVFRKSIKSSPRRRQMKKINLLYKVLSIAMLSFESLTVSCYAQYTKLFDFSDTASGSGPACSLISDGIFLYGTTEYGGHSNTGVVFKIKPDGTGFYKMHDFTDPLNGRWPVSSLIYNGSFLYGMTSSGGVIGNGTIFKIKPDGTGFAKVIDFTGSGTGAFPNGNLIAIDTFLYGMTERGGADNLGVVFKIKADGTGFSKLVEFSGIANGSKPFGSLISDGTFLYGMTNSGGADSAGTIFKIMPDGSGYVKLHDFAGGVNGKNPYGSLISDGTFLYGMTSQGGANNYGIVFKIRQDGTGFSKLLDFTGAGNGLGPAGTLISDGTYLYGTTLAGGINDNGVLFKIKPDGTGFSKMYDFVAANGIEPGNSLFSDGTFLYGMCTSGGTNTKGTLFKYQFAPTGIAEANEADSFTIYPNPSNGVFNLMMNQYENLKALDGDIYNVYGEKVFHIDNSIGKSTNLQIDLSRLSNGIYFLNLKTEKGASTQKIIINR